MTNLEEEKEILNKLATQLFLFRVPETKDVDFVKIFQKINSSDECNKLLSDNNRINNRYVFCVVGGTGGTKKMLIVHVY